MEIVRYNPSHKAVWDAFVDASKNGTFLLKRDYMEYHSDRFTDYSLLFYEGDNLRALLPASLHGKRVVSHGGLTYGGIISDRSMTVRVMLDVMSSLISFLKGEGREELAYKRVPSIYYSYPSDEDLYALFRSGAVLSKCGISSAVYLPERIRYSKGRRCNITKASKSGLVFCESSDVTGYIELLSGVLRQRHGVAPVHSSGEVIYLQSRFPDNIRLFVAEKEGRILAGSLVYETPLVAHTQYLANSEEGRSCGALDYVVDKLISEVYPAKRYFDFGISTEEGGHVLNEGLVSQKQEYGARGVVYNEYLIRL